MSEKWFNQKGGVSTIVVKNPNEKNKKGSAVEVCLIRVPKKGSPNWQQVRLLTNANELLIGVQMAIGSLKTLDVDNTHTQIITELKRLVQECLNGEPL